MFTISTEKYHIIVNAPGLPNLYAEYCQYAKLVDEIDLSNSDGTAAFVAVGNANTWPFLVVAYRCIPGEDATFHPGVLLIPETDVLFLGGGERILAYDLHTPSRLWEDCADTGFWAWDRVKDVVIMSAELELAAWDIHGKKLWSMFVEPPWFYEIQADSIPLDIMGKKLSFPLHTGPEER